MRNSLILLFFIVSSFCSAQGNYLVNETKHELINSIGNPITYVVPEKKCGDFYLTTDNGKIERSGKSCHYLIYPSKTGVAGIKIYTKSGKLIDKKFYKVRDIEFSVYIPEFDKTINDIDMFSKTARLQLKSDDLVCWDILCKTQYELIILENNQTIYKVQSSNANLSTDIRQKLASLSSGSIILFHKIKLTIGEKEFDAPDIVLEVL